MAAMIRRLISKPDRVRTAQIELLFDALVPFEAELPHDIGKLKANIRRSAAARNGWTFIMISADQNRAVVRWINANSSRPMKATTLWAELFSAIDRDTGEVMLTRDQLAELVNVGADDVSAIMGELEGIGAISRRRERVAGMRGPGRARYFMNPKVATHLPRPARDDAQADAPPAPLLRLMAGGKGKASAAGSD